MKRIPLALVPSFTSYATTRCLLVRITCKGAFEGEVFGFTNLDDTIVYEGVTYGFYNGFTPSALEATNTTGVDNGEMLGFMLEGVTYEKVRAGLFNGADVEVYEVDYMNLAAGHAIVFVGKCGETKLTDISFTTELRSITQSLTQAISQSYSKDYCRAKYGDARCKMPLEWTAGTVDTPWMTDRQRGFFSTGLAAFYKPGVVRWTTGRNAGDEMDVIESDDGFVRLMLPMPFPIAPGDQFLIRRDCDKSVAMCQGYGNEPNYRMEPLMNLTGEGLYSYTPARMDNNYGALIGAIIGAIIGYFVGDWQTGAQIGGAVGGLLLPDTAKGPRLNQASTQTNATTAPIPYGWGKVTMAGNVVEAGESKEKTKKKKNFLGVTTEKSYTYTRSFKIGVMEGQINKYLEIRRGGKTIIKDGTRSELLFDQLVSADLVANTDEVFNIIDTYPQLDAVYSGSYSAMRGLIELIADLPGGGGVPSGIHMVVLAHNFGLALKNAKGLDDINQTAGGEGVKLFYGTETQNFYACKNIDTKGLSPAYRGLAYIAYDDYDVTPSAGAIDSFEFVVDASPGRLIGTSLPYSQFMADAVKTGLLPAGGSLRSLVRQSDLESDAAIAGLLPVGGALFEVVPPVIEPSSAMAALTPSGGSLTTLLVEATMASDGFVAGLEPVGGSLTTPPVGTIDKDAVTAGIIPTSGSLTTV